MPKPPVPMKMRELLDSFHKPGACDPDTKCSTCGSAGIGSMRKEITMADTTFVAHVRRYDAYGAKLRGVLTEFERVVVGGVKYGPKTTI